MKVNSERVQYRLKGEAAEVLLAFREAEQCYDEASGELQTRIREALGLPETAIMVGHHHAGKAPIWVAFKGVPDGHAAFCNPKRGEGGSRRIRRTKKKWKALAVAMEELNRTSPGLYDKNHLRPFGFQGGYFVPPHLITPGLVEIEGEQYVFGIPKVHGHHNDKHPDHPDVEEVSLSEWAAIVEKAEAA